MYIPDGADGPLCGRCMQLEEPPWVPNHRQRMERKAERLFRGILPEVVTVWIGRFLAKPGYP